MGSLEGKVVVVTGAGRGIGLEHALLLASEGARVVVNDLGGHPDGTGGSASTADEAVSQIMSAGGQAVADHHDVSDEAGAHALIQTALDAYSTIDALVNNAGVLRDNVLVNIAPDDWDIVLRVNLRGTYLTTRAAAQYWRAQTKSGAQVSASIVNTASESGLFSNPGQANYAAAKSGVATLTQVAAKELKRYGVRVNAVLPRARTRLTEEIGGAAMQPKDGVFDRWHPANVAPFVAYLASPDSTLTGEVFLVGGSLVQRVRSWELDTGWKIKGDERWTVASLADAVAVLGAPVAAKGSGLVG